MVESGFKCPKCGQTESFTASAMTIEGPIDIYGYGYEERVGSGLNYSVPDDAAMSCTECGHKSTAYEFAECQADAWWKEDKRC